MHGWEKKVGKVKNFQLWVAFRFFWVKDKKIPAGGGGVHCSVQRPHALKGGKIINNQYEHSDKLALTYVNNILGRLGQKIPTQV